MLVRFIKQGPPGLTHGRPFMAPGVVDNVEPLAAAYLISTGFAEAVVEGKQERATVAAPEKRTEKKDA